MVVEGKLPVVPDRELSAYIKGVAEKIALEKIRKHRRQTRLESFIASHRSICLEPSDGVDHQETLQGIISRSDESERKLLDLWLLGLSAKQIAMRLCISLECCNSWRRRLRTKIQSLLSAHC